MKNVRSPSGNLVGAVQALEHPVPPPDPDPPPHPEPPPDEPPTGDDEPVPDEG